ncbi:xanthine dehydrogenase family protein subunit M [Belnapia sp. T6]|uniref:Xanthine dehydrogenase family protein subunit M n=1 Tax=Belnapia mucosa TaxID=2804532 RepID=A0ABS1VBQ1_9PROT|nr:xanthine dehydrogenase family protein subunit M [Belnapia mucosa]MBL6459099.1 xanthine dehydrogenase family protein subunit M [Belnapia mucosa]
MRPFDYQQAQGTAAALALAAQHLAPPGEERILAPAQYLAGGTNLLDLMKIGVAHPPALINITALRQDHGRIETDASGLRLGALARMAEAAEHPAVLRDYPAIAQSLQLAASQQLRNMATLGGNVLQRTRCNYFRDPSWQACNKRVPGTGCAAMAGVNRRLAVLGVSEHCIAHYPGDFANVLAALGAEVEILSSDGTARRIAFEELHRLPGDAPHIDTNLRPGELIISFRVPAGPWTRRSLYLKIRDRESYDFAQASAVVALDLQDGVVREARVGLGGLVAKPWRSHEAEAALRGRKLDQASAQASADAAFQGAVTHGENAFKPELGRRTLVRALLQAAAMET